MTSPRRKIKRLCWVQARELRVPLVEQDRTHYVALLKRKVGVSWDGRRIVAPPGVVDSNGMVDLSPAMKKGE